MISVKDLSKEFNGVRALEGVSLEIEKGETFGLIGPNGAGKTTCINILTGQIAPTRGELLLQGEPVDPGEASYRLRVGLVPQEPSFYGRLSAEENLRLLGRLYGGGKTEVDARAEELLSWVGLREHAHRQVRRFSRGMQQRLSLAMGLVHKPDIMYLDEPTSGLDPAARSAIWDLIGRMSAEGRSIFLTTHNMEEADHICDRLALLVKGVVREKGTPSYIKGLLGKDQLELRLTESRDHDLNALCGRLGLSWRMEGETAVLTGPDLTEKLPLVITDMAGYIRNLHYREVTLEDAFLRFMREVED